MSLILKSAFPTFVVRHLPLLPDYANTVLGSLICFSVLQHWVAPYIARRMLGQEAWAKTSPRTRAGLYVSYLTDLRRFVLYESFIVSATRVVAFVHAVLVIPLATRCLNSPALNNNRAFGWDERCGPLVAISVACVPIGSCNLW